MKKLLPALIFLLLALQASSQNHPTCSGSVIPSDDCSTACIVCDLNGYFGQTGGFTAGIAPGFCGSVESEQWIGFRANTDTISVTLQPVNCQLGHGLQAAIYQGCQDVPVICNGGALGGGNTPVTMSTVLEPGQTYFLMVDGYQGDVCQFAVSVSPAGASKIPAVGAIQGPTVVAPNSTIVYSVLPVFNANAYVWNAPLGSIINGQMPPALLPPGSGYQVSVTFTGDVPNSGMICVNADNGCNGNPSSCLAISVSDGYLPPACPNTVTPSGDDCASACVYCDFNGYAGNTANYSPGISPPGFCGTIENDQWFGYIAGASSATFTATPSNCVNGDGIQVALLENCGSFPIECNGGTEGSGNIPVSVFADNLIPGQTYFLLIDGFGGDQCDFTVSVTPPSAVAAPVLGTSSPIQGPSMICQGEIVNFSVPPVEGAGAYIWTAPLGSLINGYASPAQIVGVGGNQVQIKFGVVGGSICVTPINSCDGDNSPTCMQVTIHPPIITVLAPVIVCHEELPYELPWGELVTTPGIYETSSNAAQGCDSIVRQQVIVLPAKVTSLPTKTLCPGECFTVCGEEFCDPGPFTHYCQSFQGCDSIVNFSITVLNPIAEISSNNTVLSCTNACITLNSTPVILATKTWKNLAGQILGTGNTLIVCAPGTYILNTAVSGGGKTCTAQDTITVLGDFSIPDVSAAGGELNCLNSVVTLDGSSNTAGVLFSWSGPGNFTSTLEDPTVNDPGDYTLIVTHPGSGCTSSAVATVSISSDAVLVDVAANILTCLDISTTLTTVTNISTATFSWDGPGNFVSTLQNPTVSLPGTYTVTVTNADNGCSATASITIEIDQTAPDLSITGGILDCAHTDLTLDANSTTPGVVFLWIGTGGFTSAEEDPTISQPGLYTVTAVTPNGCSTSLSIFVPLDLSPPQIQVQQIINDHNSQGTGSIQIGTNALIITWTLLGQVVGTSEVLDSLFAGTYVVVAEGYNGCTATMLVTIQNTVATHELQNQIEWKIFPNPSDQLLFADFSAWEGQEIGVQVFNSQGQGVSMRRMVAGSNAQFIELPQRIAAGLYTLQITLENGEKRSKRFVIQH